MIQIVLTSPTAAELHHADGTETITTTPGQDLQEQIIQHLVRRARRDGEDLTAHATNDDTWLHITPTGTVTPTTPPEPASPTASQTAPAAASDSENEPASGSQAARPNPLAPAPRKETRTAPAPNDKPAQPTTTVEPARTRASLREATFLVSETPLEPATQGWRGGLNNLGFRLAPSAQEQAERDDVRTVSQHWPGPRTVAVVNRKGGANKTPTVALLAAMLARHGGGPVLAWDNNESQGTLGWRTEQGPHTASVLDLVDSSTRLLSPEANSADLAHFVHHQTADKYDVLRSDENDEGDHEITAEEVDIAHRVASKFYRLIVMDSGNTARSANWRRMIDHTHQLVVPVTAMEDRAEAARLTLQTLESRGGHDAQLAHNAVVIVSESTDAARGLGRDGLKQARDEAARIAEGFTPLVRTVVRVPYDPALIRGHIKVDALRPQTQRAWLAAAAAVAKGF